MEQVDLLVEALVASVAHLRKLSPAYVYADCSRDVGWC